MVLEGTVTNVAAFGAFVDIGVHQDGLVHVSAMSHNFVKDPHDVVHSSKVVKVKVVEVDEARQRVVYRCAWMMSRVGVKPQSSPRRSLANRERNSPPRKVAWRQPSSARDLEDLRKPAILSGLNLLWVRTCRRAIGAKSRMALYPDDRKD